MESFTNTEEDERSKRIKRDLCLLKLKILKERIESAKREQQQEQQEEEERQRLRNGGLTSGTRENEVNEVDSKSSAVLAELVNQVKVLNEKVDLSLSQVKAPPGPLPAAPLTTEGIYKSLFSDAHVVF
jgi:hypothetical protein